MSRFTAPPIFDEEMIRRYDTRGPRYTSYPTADRFSEPFSAETSRRYLLERAHASKHESLSLYFHLPFCHTICYYCACNKIITQDHGRSAKYIRYLGKELALQAELLAPQDRRVSQLHWGGGTPTFLSDEEMARLMALTHQYFELEEDGEYSIEIDPRRVNSATIARLHELGFNRMSLGVQDFDDAVQRSIHRVQSEEETRAVVDAARENGFRSISFDLIYGLPKQSLAGFERTLERSLAMSPDRFSIYNYAHLPSLFKPQRRIADADLPSASLRLQLLALAIAKLSDAGYRYIGMDHFAKPDDELSLAQQAGRLHRNFQGYSTHADCDMLAFGISSISKVGAAYYQNHKTLDAYYASLDAGVLPVFRGIELTNDDLLRRAIIQALMCHGELVMAHIESAFAIDFASYFAPELESLRERESAGLLRVVDGRISILPAGRFLIRAIAMIFDPYLREVTAVTRYSKLI